ncbi:hypothetical protein [Clostridioides sp. ZZV15-6597]|uniref:hypothetical protein n=1 Tax=Clostridioides sp. ZZV15-6597 TaxID=2811500 RepID=UPI001D115FEF|nr:hypothetical protein [Clostridioides sp. ZZV15-6597]HBF1820683.1 hypothetical protein [Clostridioides difficile]
MKNTVRNGFLYKNINNENKCVTIGTSIPVDKFKLQSIYDENMKNEVYKYSSFYVKYESNFSKLNIYKDIKGKLYHDKEQNPEQLVIYKNLYDSLGAFAISIKKFISSNEMFTPAKNIEALKLIFASIFLLTVTVVSILILVIKYQI